MSRSFLPYRPIVARTPLNDGSRADNFIIYLFVYFICNVIHPLEEPLSMSYGDDVTYCTTDCRSQPFYFMCNGHCKIFDFERILEFPRIYCWSSFRTQDRTATCFSFKLFSKQCISIELKEKRFLYQTYHI